MTGGTEEDAIDTWMRSNGFVWYATSGEGYWTIDHDNGTHESVAPLVARRFYRLLAEARKKSYHRGYNTGWVANARGQKPGQPIEVYCASCNEVIAEITAALGGKSDE